MKVLLICLLASTAFAQELKRPTVDTDFHTTTSMGCTGTNEASTSMPKAYDSLGQATSATQTLFGDGGSTSRFYVTRGFGTWQTTKTAYTALTLNVNAQTLGNAGTGFAKGRIVYSIDNGATWVSIFDDTGNALARQSYSITLSPTQDLTRLRVGLCIQAAGSRAGDPGSDAVTVWDIWTLGTPTAAANSGTGSSAGVRHNAVIVN